MNVDAVRAQLEALVDPEYQAFNAALIPGVDNVLGVRMPALRRLAKDIARGDWRSYLGCARHDSHEETLLQGLVIAYAKVETEALLPLIRAHVEKLSNWSDCDVFCGGLKVAKAEPDRLWAFVEPYYDRTEPYPLRFAIVMSLSYFLGDAHIDRVLSRLGAVRHEDYYVRMAVAWAVSMAYVAQRERTLAFLEDSPLDDWTHNKALQKVIESRQVDDAERALMRTLKRKGSRKP